MRYGHSFQLASTSEDPFNRTTLTLVDLWDFSWLGWIALETSFPKSPRSLKTEFGVKRYDVFREVTYAVSESCGSAAHKGGSAAPVQVLMASFGTPMASFGFRCIYTHPTAPGLAADDQNITKPCEDSLNWCQNYEDHISIGID